MKTNMISIRKRSLWLFCTGLSALAVLAVSCNKDKGAVPPSGETASLTVTLSGQTAQGRAVAPTGSTEADALKAAENRLKNVTVFVFNDNGTLDKKQAFASDDLSETITGLIAGPKKIVVAANVPDGITFPDGINYDWFADPKNVINLDSQSPETNGLFMSGEETATLSANTVTEKTIPVSRVVAKVKLGTITLEPEAGHDPAKFSLQRVAVMKARGSALMGIPSVAYTPDLFYGGMAGDKSVEKSYLAENITTGDYANRYFYVLPSDNDDNNATLLTLVGTYDGKTTYFPFRINDKVGSDGATSDGKFILRNNVYTVNVKLKRLGGGSSDPEVPADPASLTVTVEPQPWETELIQNVEW